MNTTAITSFTPATRAFRLKAVFSRGSSLTVVEAESEAVFVHLMTTAGHPMTGRNTNPRQREELRGQPKFAGLAGPMWGVDHIRYECAETYRTLSA